MTSLYALLLKVQAMLPIGPTSRRRRAVFLCRIGRHLARKLQCTKLTVLPMAYSAGQHGLMAQQIWTPTMMPRITSFWVASHILCQFLLGFHQYAGL